MMKLIKTFLLLLLAVSAGYAQDYALLDRLNDTYDEFKETTLTKRRIKHGDITTLIDRLANLPEYTVRQVGTSIEGRSIRIVSVGEGSTSVLLWSQMHGNEPTATQSIFDIFNFLTSDQFTAEKQELLQQVTLHFVPMLNPDGAQIYRRYNALGIDINRDALRLQTPEGQVLKYVRDSLDADFGFNLHDQSRYYNAELTPKPATLSYLAPAYNYDKSINEVRGNAMKIIVLMNDIIQKYAPGQVGRYNDDFEPRAFGDNIQKWGTSAILIESGGFQNDREKQFIRKLNYLSILTAIFTIADGSFREVDIAKYETIPNNDRKLFDLKLIGVMYNLLGGDYKIDLGIHRWEIDDTTHESFHLLSQISDIGDLSTFYGYETLDANGMRIVAPQVYEKVQTMTTLKDLNHKELLKQGYGYIQVSDIPSGIRHSKYPLHLVSEGYRPKFSIDRNSQPTFFLVENGTLRYAVINGFLVDLNGDETPVWNSLIYR